MLTHVIGIQLFYECQLEAVYIRKSSKTSVKLNFSVPINLRDTLTSAWLDLAIRSRSVLGSVRIKIALNTYRA